MLIRFYALRHPQVHGDRILYIGSTKNSLAKRLSQHLAQAKNRPHCLIYKAMMAYNTYGWTISLLAEKDITPYSSVRDRHPLENELKAIYKPLFNETQGMCYEYDNPYYDNNNNNNKEDYKKRKKKKKKKKTNKKRNR